MIDIVRKHYIKQVDEHGLPRFIYNCTECDTCLEKDEALFHLLSHIVIELKKLNYRRKK